MDLNVKLNTYIAKASNYGGKRSTDSIKYLVIHYTANNGDTAKGNGKYFASNNTGTSAHYFVDENEIVQSVYDNYVAWHCGGSKYYHRECRNNNSIGIELCSRKIGNKYYFKDETIENALELTKALMSKYNIGIENVIRHYDVTHKICPEPFVRDNNLWLNFKNMLIENKEVDDEMVETGAINVNGKDIKIDKILKEDVTYIKLRGLENAGFKVGYNSDTKALSLKNTLSEIDVNVNGEYKKLEAVNIEGRNYIAIRDVEKLFNSAKVDYVDGNVVVTM